MYGAIRGNSSAGRLRTPLRLHPRGFPHIIGDALQAGEYDHAKKGVGPTSGPFLEIDVTLKFARKRAPRASLLVSLDLASRKPELCGALSNIRRKRPVGFILNSLRWIS